MATRKIILDFKQQPIVGSGFQYKIHINGVLLTYTNGQNALDLEYKAGGNNSPFQIGLGADLNATINNTLSFLQSVWGANSTSGSYLTSLSYVRVGNTIEVIINSTAPQSLITRWELVSSQDYIRFITETPCTTIFLANYTNLALLNSTGPITYRNQSLNQIISTYPPTQYIGRFDVETQRGFNFVVSDAFGSQHAFSTAESIQNSAVQLNQVENTINVTIITSQPSFGVTFLNNVFLYSIDGNNYQTSNSFTDLEDGDYTLYVKDVYGCIKTFLFSVSQENQQNEIQPYTYISESNSLRFVKRVDWGNCSNYKNVFNTLSFEENTRPAYKFLQKYQSCDTIKTQIKTSYQNVEVVAGTTEITAEKIVANIGIEDKRDCFYYNFEGNLAILYTSGNLYLYDTDDVVGTYELNGQLPEYGVIGNFVETDFGTYQIINIRIDDNGNRSLILNSNSVPSSSNENGQVQIIFNRETYDIWEFDIPMNDFLNQVFKVGIRFYQTEEDENWPDVFWISECISVKERWPYSKKIVWRNSKNTDIYFYSGIEMMARLDFCQVESNLSDGEVEIQKTDSQVLAIENTDYKAISLEIQNLTTGMVRKLKLAVKHDYLVIEDVPYVLADSPEINNLKPSNFYTFTAKLLEAGDVFNTGTANTQTVITGGELIGLLSGDDTNEYIRIL